MEMCTVGGCGNPRRSSGQVLCHAHQSQKQRGKPFAPLRTRHVSVDHDAKFCLRCEVEKPRSEFYKNSAAGDGLHSYCKSCSRDYDKTKYPNGKPGKRPRYLMQTYGLTEDAWDELFDAQGRVCAICGTEPARPVTDHCHDTGEVRGILCDTCNRSMGLLKDDATVLISAAAYLIAHQTRLVECGG